MQQEPATELAVAAVRYLPDDGQDEAAEWRVDIIDLKASGRPTVASLELDEAVAVAGRLREEELKARVRRDRI